MSHQQPPACPCLVALGSSRGPQEGATPQHVGHSRARARLPVHAKDSSLIRSGRLHDFSFPHS